MRRSSAERFDPKRKKQPRGSSYNQQQVALGDCCGPRRRCYARAGVSHDRNLVTDEAQLIAEGMTAMA